MINSFSFTLSGKLLKKKRFYLFFLERKERREKERERDFDVGLPIVYPLLAT